MHLRLGQRGRVAKLGKEGGRHLVDLDVRRLRSVRVADDSRSINWPRRLQGVWPWCWCRSGGRARTCAESVTATSSWKVEPWLSGMGGLGKRASSSPRMRSTCVR